MSNLNIEQKLQTNGMPFVLDQFRHRIDEHIARVISELKRDGPEHNHPLIGRVYRWMNHYLDSGGKRMHGIAVILAYQACGGIDEEAVLPVAAALQLYHHHTLVHDDIYDEDLARRGWPTSHQAFAEWFRKTASGIDTSDHRVFTSDALRRGTITAFAYGKICRALPSHMILNTAFPSDARLDVARKLDWHDLFDNAAQLKDVYHEGGAMPDPQTCLENAWLKTGRLFEICAYAGSRLAGANVSQQRALETWASQSALAYQLQDDLEDLVLDSEKGKGRGIATDLLHCKPTYLYAMAKILAVDGDRESLVRWQSGEKAGLSVSDIIALLERSGAIAACRAEVTRCVNHAENALETAKPALKAEIRNRLREFAIYFVSPDYWQRSLIIDERRADALLT